YSRNAKSLTDSFPEIAAELKNLGKLRGEPVVLDGEVVAFDRKGVSRFQLLQRRDLGLPIRPVYAVFDCLALGGKSLLDTPLSDRRKALEQVVPERGELVFRSRRLSADGLAAYAQAKRRGWEGVISKLESSLYRPGLRTREWLKVKVRKES